MTLVPCGVSMLRAPAKGGVSSVQTTPPEAQRYIAEWWRLGYSTDIRLWCHPLNASAPIPGTVLTRVHSLHRALNDGGGRAAGYERANADKMLECCLVAVSFHSGRF